MELGLRDKNVFVAGSSRGIGKAIAASFLAEGARVAVSGRDQTALAATVAELRAVAGDERVIACCGDLRQRAFVAEALTEIRQKLGGLDVLVANVGSGRGRVGWQLDDADWTELFEINLAASVRVVTEAIPMLTDGAGGSVIMVSSIAGLEALAAPLPYSAAKAALVSFSKNLAHQLAAQRVRVNCVAPGNVLFPGGSWDKKLQDDERATRAYVAATVPMQRFGSAQEIADVVVFLASERASFVTGACVVVDGGQTRAL